MQYDFVYNVLPEVNIIPIRCPGYLNVSIDELKAYMKNSNHNQVTC